MKRSSRLSLLALAAFLVTSPVSPAAALRDCAHHSPAAASHGESHESDHSGSDHGQDAPCTCASPCQQAVQAALPSTGGASIHARPAVAESSAAPLDPAPVSARWLLPFANAPPAPALSV